MASPPRNDSQPDKSVESQADPISSKAEPPAPPAMSCSGVKTAVDDAHCCWPGQSWSGEHEACIGKPTSCPDAHEALCNACVQVATLSPMVKISAGVAALRAKRCPQKVVRGPAVHYVPGFEIDQFEVTVAQREYFNAHSADRAATEKGEVCVLKMPKPSIKCSQEPDSAANCTGYHVARRYCAWAGKVLPTAKQWDRALSAGGAWWKQQTEEAWYCQPELHSGSCLVSQFPKDVTPLGIAGMYGSVSEWTTTMGRSIAKDCPQPGRPIFSHSVMSAKEPASTEYLHCYAGVCSEELERRWKGLTGVRCVT